MRWCLLIVVAAVAWGEDPVAALARRMEQGSVRLRFEPDEGYLRPLLHALDVPVESQMAVFSKTSIQSLRIEPANPRMLYFNDSVAVGWVRGGFIELAAQDPEHGLQFYTLQQRADERIVRRDDCLNCHKDRLAMLRSVRSTPDGIPSQEIDTDDRTPFETLWGGWFVTGNIVPAVHRGNVVFAHSEKRELAPTASSDVAALMVFAHQIRMMNLLAHPENVNELADALLFIDEAPLPGPIHGSSGFAERFSEEGPRDDLGRSLREFDLTKRLMRYPCSYMIYSDAFNASPVKDAVYRRMWRILSGQETGSKYQRISASDRKAVIEILRDTKNDLPSCFRGR